MGLMISLLLIIFIWLLFETDYLRIRLLIGNLPVPEEIIELKRITWDECKNNYGTKQITWKGNHEPVCGWGWLENNSHPIPQVKVDINTGGVKYHWNIQDTVILNDAIKATHYKAPKQKSLKLKKNKHGGFVAPLPPKAR